MPIIKLDLDALVDAGELAPDEARRLAALALPQTAGRLWISCLLIFGALAVAAGAIALVPTPATGLVLALLALGGAVALRRIEAGEAWRVLAAGFAIMGAVGIAGWIAAETWEAENAFWPPLAITAVLTGCALAFRSAFLAALAVLAAGAVLGTGTVCWHAAYGLFVREPTLTILAFGALAGGLYWLRARLDDGWQGLATVAARTSFFLMQFGFWVGSLWGDWIGEHWAAGDRWRAAADWREGALYLPEAVFSLGWAGALIAMIILARRGGFLSVASVVFLAIHAYTQYFETFGAEPLTLLIAGIIAVAGAAFGARWVAGRGLDLKIGS